MTGSDAFEWLNKSRSFDVHTVGDATVWLISRKYAACLFPIEMDDLCRAWLAHRAVQELTAARQGEAE